ncbi:TIGR00730 family Rossman fold protein [Xinfangfangia sp. CPCC 101601]|uniref:Cytokinin riboside 5'-monophosphate phosphoribohydrolase n=1 Tax=Pseudogemmobacter lacusdianii TaxID=3069608 RepID=A0ABU0VZK0_9RHOB|nr:TIGR00730 family Rossman fold protein [Xinfangfangia sp. CPCC 101601]MDQ2066625.1 TIGR00730 family Rossman fold protein [Xinfangfangia sp. CPCC 101601]
MASASAPTPATAPLDAPRAANTAPSICVFCGARPGTNPAHVTAAQSFGKTLARRGWRLVYGAGDVGIMGEVARAAQNAGANCFGVIPVHLMGAERGKRDLTTFVITEDMHERKKVMFMNSDAIVVLPGGAGSLDEFFEVLTWAQIGLHKKPILLVDVAGYWQPLVAMIQHIVAEGFADASLLQLFQVVPDVAAAEAALVAHFPAAS